jgi:hypothetical protein
MLRVSGYSLIVCSMIHVLFGGWIFATPLTDILQNGLFNAVAPDPFAPYFDREDAFWFMMIAPLIFTIGRLCCWAKSQEIALPAFLGWNLLAFSLIGIFFEPISGLWLLIPPAILIVLASRKAIGLTSPMTGDR